MIIRFFSILLLLYVLGFIVFAVTLGAPSADERTDAAVSLTGGGGRIEHGIHVLSDGKVKRLLISGADPSVTKPDLIERLGGKADLVECCVDLDSVSVDTRSNAEETGRWLEEHGFKSFRLITSDWHMLRARYEFRRVLRDRFVIVPDAVRSEPSFMTLLSEYNKYLLRRVAILFEI
jgi:uncharacterized SAM-binding protein YcdF (DUF218 family)